MSIRAPPSAAGSVLDQSGRGQDEGEGRAVDRPAGDLQPDGEVPPPEAVADALGRHREDGRQAEDRGGQGGFGPGFARRLPGVFNAVQQQDVPSPWRASSNGSPPPQPAKRP